MNGRVRWLSIAGAVIALGGFAWVFTRIDLAELRATFAGAGPLFLALVPAAIIAEQWVRAWKWRQLMYPLCSVSTPRLFGGIMVGYFVNLLVPLGASPLVRSWLIARLEMLKTSTVLATAALDRLIDGVVFTTIVALVVILAAFPDPQGNIRLALVAGGGVSLALFLGLLFALNRHKRQVSAETSWLLRQCTRLPLRMAPRVQDMMVSFAEGVVWPRERWRWLAIIAASVVIKLIAATHFLWAGRAFGLLLTPLDYLFLLVFLGFLVILNRFTRVPGGFLLGSIFALEQLGVGREQAAATATLLVVANMLTISLIGALTLWRHGVTLAELRAEPAHAANPP